MKELIEFLEKRGGRQADSLRKGDTTLYLGSNKIGDSEAKELALMLKDNSTLTSLDLSDNKIGETGARDLAASLKDNNSLGD